jgi:SAM-dependent methyltransferase
MADWLERVDRSADPSILVEHVVRYRLARVAISTTDVWMDLGCGTGAAAAMALGDDLPDQVLLVDRDEPSLRLAAREFDDDRVRTFRADLASERDLSAIALAVRTAPGASRCITCMETIEHLAHFGPLVTWLVGLAEEADTTVIISVPNDAHSGIDNPFHVTTWGEGAIAELRTLLPPGHVALRQVPITGSGIVCDGAAAELELRGTVGGEAVPSHFLVAFGPRAGALQAVGAIRQVDLDARRGWEREREADLAYFRQRGDAGA